MSYKRREMQPYPVLGPYLETIDGWLEGDKGRPRKQRHTAVRIYNRLKQEHGFTGGESTVRRYVREAKLRLGVGAKPVYIPCDPQIGVEAELDWGRLFGDIEGRGDAVEAVLHAFEIFGQAFCTVLSL